MSNLLKSKFFLGVMIVAVMLVAGVVSTSSANAASCSITTTLKVGSKGAEVSCLQTNLGLTADGSFGPKTKAAVMSFQTAHGLTADGVFGAASRSAWMGTASTGSTGGSYPAGCMSSTGFSSTTGVSCSGAMSYPAGCMSSTGFSTTTGMSCAGSGSMTLPAGCASASGFSSTTGVACTATTGVATSGTNGYLTDFSSDSTNRVSTVYESEQDKVVAGFRATARLASQTVNRVRVQMRNTDTGGSSANLAKYITGASLWLGSTKLATMAVIDADRSTSNDTYTFNFAGINGMVAKDAIGRFYVSVSANGSLDSNDATNANWAVTFPDGGVQAVSPDGSVDTYNASSGNVGTLLGSNVGFTFGKFSANGVKATVGLSTNNPSGSVVTVQNTAATNAVTLLKFTVKATNSNLKIRSLPIQVTSTTADVAMIVNTIKIYRGANLVDSLDGSAIVDVNSGVCDVTDTTSIGVSGCYVFTNLSSPDNMITSGDTAEFSVVVDLKQVSGNYAEGETLMASLTNADALLTANLSINDVNGDQLTAGSTYRVGSAVGEIQTLRINGVVAVMGTPSYTSVTDSGNVTQVTYTIPVTATAFGQTLYIGQAVQLADVATGTTTTANALALSFEDSSAPATHVNSCTSCVYTFASSDATIESNGFRLDSGTARHFTITVTEITPTTPARSYRIQLNQIRSFTESTLTSGAANQALVPVQNFQTGYQYITS